DYVRAIRRVVERHCRGNPPDNMEVRCRLGEAWIAEYEGETDRAERIYQGLVGGMASARILPLARLYARHGKCLELSTFINRMKENRELDRANLRKLEESAKTCAER
ncbi:MAG: hypothetical protein ABEN55_08945, partial [Bradymonadaceae bacterium]